MPFLDFVPSVPENPREEILFHVSVSWHFRYIKKEYNSGKTKYSKTILIAIILMALAVN